MISLAVYLAELLVLITNLPYTRATCSSAQNPAALPNLNLGLPANSNVFVSGYLPIENNWRCQTGDTVYNNVNAVYWSYYSHGTPVELAISNSDQLQNADQWALYIYQGNNYGYMHFKICKWNGKYSFINNPYPSRGVCMYNKKFRFVFPHARNTVIGASWSGDYVTLFTTTSARRFYLKNNWSRVNVKCQLAESCAIQTVSNISTLNITTNQQGLIQSYSVCTECDGFPKHVFPVLDDGKIPGDFSFSNWFVLTNSSTVLQGRIVTVQPLKLLCLWPVPSLNANDKPVYFNLSLNSDVRCNGHSIAGYAQALRFSLNFTANQVLNGVHSIKLFSSNQNFTFTCSTNGTLERIPFGRVESVYKCFVRIDAINSTKNLFVGILPPVTKEFVISRYGAVYINGVHIMSLPPLESVIFNVTSSVGSDFWTVAFADEAEVLLDLNATNIVDILYCDTLVNKIKCQNLAFSLEDGFYATSKLIERHIPRSFITLPYHVTHSVVGLDVRIYYENEAASNLTLSPSDPVCVDSSQFSTYFNVTADTNGFNARIINVDCPFTFDKLNNYISFESICFSLEPFAGGCSMRIESFFSSYVRTVGSLYILFKNGNKITGVTESSAGVYDTSFLHTDICTDYTIYGTTGRGVITKLNTTIIAGLYYTSQSGQIFGFKNATNGDIYAVRPCDLSSQAAVVSNQIVAVMSASENITFGFNNSLELPKFYLHSNAENATNCTEPVLIYGKIGICEDGSITEVKPRIAEPEPYSPIVTANITIPSNFSISVQAEYVQMFLTPVSVDCNMYVCNGNRHCLRLLGEYVTACKNIEAALQLSARLESIEVNNFITVSENAISLANISNFDSYNLSVLLPKQNGKSVIEDILFDKVVTNGLGTVDQDYKECIKRSGVKDVADVACAQYYNGIMVLPGVVDDVKMGLYTASLTGAMVMGGLTAAAAIPFSIAVQSRLNYVALQTDVLQKNQQILADSFNNAMSNITMAFAQVNDAIKETSQAISTVAQALSKVQSVVNEQGEALSQLTKQLASNFQAISSSIEDIYNRLDMIAADAQVDRLITGRIGALNAFVTQTLTKYTEVRASRQLALQKINECVKSQSSRFGFCGNGTHLFSIANAAPNGIMLFHTVLMPTEYVVVRAWAGLCIEDKAFVLRDVKTTLFKTGDTYYITTRDMYQPRLPQVSDFVQIKDCQVDYLNLTSDEVNNVIPDYIDVNKTLEDFGQILANNTRPPIPDFGLDIYNNTILNLTAEIDVLQNKSEQLLASTERLQQLIDNLNKTYVDLEWLNRFEQYIKWPWYVWLAIFLAVILFSFLMLYCCCATGCCGCFSCLSNSCDCRGKNLQRYEVEKVHIQ
uniref:Spike glycoprotein n=1 Tax=Hipposideros bat coronavirus HKU10 TaxID=1241932 RepID=K4JZ69_9ALPC|nr:spike glycoprotein [Hipposideros bat coronavirus HKU10]